MMMIKRNRIQMRRKEETRLRANKANNKKVCD